MAIMSRSTRARIADAVAHYGLLLSDETPVTGAPVTPGTIRVVISRMKAAVPGCPDFSRGKGTDFENNTSSNMGCAVNSNLAAMVANPADLVRGQPGAETTDVATSYKAIDTYRRAVPTGKADLKTEKTGGN
jgi:pilus assembly protein CpaD